MKQNLLFLFLLCCGLSVSSQTASLTLKKGTVVDSVQVSPKSKESYSLYLPIDFSPSRKWPVLFVFDLQGNGKRALGVLKGAAEEEGFILVASNAVRDSLSISDNLLVANRLIKGVAELLPLRRGSVYTAGFSSGAKLASAIPFFIKQVDGMVSLGSPMANTELLNTRKKLQYIGLVGTEDFNYPEMLEQRKMMNKLRIANQLFVFEGGHKWPEQQYLVKALRAIRLHSMARGNQRKDSLYIRKNYSADVEDLRILLNRGQKLGAYNYLGQMIELYGPLINSDSMENTQKMLRKDKGYRAQRRAENALLFKESLLRDEYDFNLLEDITTLNYNNLGWWNYQMEELAKFEDNARAGQRYLGKRLIGYLNALVEDNIDIEEAQDPVNVEAISFLWMLKTITEPDNYDFYLKLISDSARYEDYGTALFYLEELLKQGYDDKAALYSLEHTALLRIMPEFNDIVRKYLSDARYDINRQ